MTKKHTFHIPIMGVSFTIDSPLRVSQYGIDSVVSLVDDSLFEKLRKMYSEKFEVPYHEITDKIEDFRAKRITSYLNMMNEQAEKKIEELKNAGSEKLNEIKEYFNMLPDSSEIKQEFNQLTEKYFNFSEIKNWLNENISVGSIDVNIMTKVDKANYRKGEKLPIEYNDAHAALRGYAKSDLKSSVILSAGMSPRLYSYIEKFDDFFPDENGEIKKKVVLKVSDYRSALIQGKFLAKKGIWVSEYRIESGLNCGGHAFATDGFLMGPILNEFKIHREQLIESVNEILVDALEKKGRIVPKNKLALKITAQGGVGTNEEHNFLMEEYGIDSVGWGSPFLLVPEATSVDEHTRKQLVNATEDDLYLSGISPLGVPFNSLRGNTKDIEKLSLAEQGKPGSSCPKRFLVSNTEFTEKPICTASIRYQRLKLKELDSAALPVEEHQKQYNKIVEKSCLCVGLRTSSLLENSLDRDGQSDGVSVCPGPNTAYFSRQLSLKEMVDHIYGRTNVIMRTDRPNMFVKELGIYIEYLQGKIDETKSQWNAKQEKYLMTFANNLKDGVKYYQNLFTELKDKFEDSKEDVLNDLKKSTLAIQVMSREIEMLAKKKLEVALVNP